jgi:hypothetical protein
MNVLRLTEKTEFCQGGGPFRRNISGPLAAALPFLLNWNA